MDTYRGYILSGCATLPYELPLAVSHKEGVAVVYGVAQLEREHGVRAQLAESVTQLGRGQPVKKGDTG